MKRIIKTIPTSSLFIVASALLLLTSEPVSGEDSLNAGFLRLAADYSEAHNGFSVLVKIKGKTVFEEYHNGHSADRAYRLASGTKSFWGVLAICAQEDGLLDLDEKAADTLTEWKDDPRKSKITIRHLLTFTSGLDPANTVLRGLGTDNKYLYALGVKTKHDPGTTFEYGASHLFSFGELLRRKLEASGERGTPLDYLRKRILQPIGLKVRDWSSDKAGNPPLPFGAFLTAREWVKYGELILNRGKWDGKQLLPGKRLKECFQGTAANPRYGLNWWLLGVPVRDEASSPGDSESAETSETFQIPADTVAAMGAGKQRLYVIPSLDMVVVRQGEGTSFQDGAFLGRLLVGKEVKSPPPSASRSPVARTFRTHDKNGDGKLTPDEAPDPELFKKIDLDGNGLVTLAELEQYYRSR